MVYIFLCFVRNILSRSSYFSPMQAKGFIFRKKQVMEYKAFVNKLK